MSSSFRLFTAEGKDKRQQTMKSLTEPMLASAEYNRITVALTGEKGNVLAEGCVDPQKLHLIHAVSKDERLADHGRFCLIVTSSDKKAQEIARDYVFYDRQTYVFPGKDLIFYQADLRSREIQMQRIRCLRRIVEGRPLTVVTTFAALMTPQVPIGILRKNIIRIEKGDTFDQQALVRQLVLLGYEKNAQVDGPGQFAVRGDLLDVFDLTEENPYRIEFFDNEVETIRSFDAESQRSIEQLSMIRIYPATELILDEKRLSRGLSKIREETAATAKKLRASGKTQEAGTLQQQIRDLEEEVTEWHDYTKLEGFIHYFYPETDSFLDLFKTMDTLLFLDEPERLLQEGQAVELEFKESMTGRAERGLVIPGQMHLLTPVGTLEYKISLYRRLGLAALLQGNTFFEHAECVSLHARNVPPYNSSFESLVENLKKLRAQQYRVIIISASRTRAKRLAQDLTERSITTFYSENPDRVLQPREVMTYYGHLSSGFEYTDLKFMVIAESDIFGVQKKKKKSSGSGPAKNRIRSFEDLHVGDYVVHEDYGIGMYEGVEKITVDNSSQDYIKLRYAGSQTLYVLPTDLHSLQKYASASAAKPKLSTFGGSDWKKTKSKVKGAVEEVAQDLVELYAKRQSQKGFTFSKDTVWQKEFEEMFPYQETQDQLAAIEDTKKDMESGKIMDRLICGDVGFGKTEIAVRAAFKAVQDEKQVAVLVPTTILAQQHYNTFIERMKDFPVNIELMSRFRTPAEQKNAIAGLKSGRVDIVIGTHRILSKDVAFKDLGLLVIDEEQRFGVAAKEKIKKLRASVDVLTLSATPIPRTLHMSLTGIRDMSVLEEAPQDRVPIQTYVMEYNEEMVREAILRELSRKGQVYYVYNKVNDIALVTGRLRELVPEARIGFAHGQMSESELEKIMYDFISGDIDVLVSTTIIETGLDISNVNTIIIHDADKMGLSQLYQLRGRVGRSNRGAYAFLLYKPGRLLPEVAEKRLSAIREFTDLGSGFRIAMRDLEIRGAGSILGKSQHGHMAAVGYDLYCKMLEEAVKKAKGEPVMEQRHTSIRLLADAYIPDEYIVNEAQKLEIYKKISQIGGVDDCSDVRDELRDRFGDKIPLPARNLLRIALIRATAEKTGIIDITGEAGKVRFTLDHSGSFRAENIPALIKRYKGGLRFIAKGEGKGELAGEPYFELEYPKDPIRDADGEMLLSIVEKFITQFSELLR